MADFSLDQYIKELLKDAEAQLPAEKVETFREVLAHEKVSPRVKELALTRSDYSRNMDELRKNKEQLEQKVRETEQFYAAQIQADHNNRQAFAALQQENERLKNQGYYPNDPPPLDTSKLLTREDYQKETQKLQQEALDIMANSTLYAMQHFQEFGQVLNPKELYNHAIKTGLPLESAYDSFVRDIREKRNAEQREADLKKAREEGAREALSRHKIPLVDNRPRGIHALKAGAEVPKTSNDRVAAATEAYLRGES